MVSRHLPAAIEPPLLDHLTHVAVSAAIRVQGQAGPVDPSLLATQIANRTLTFDPDPRTGTWTEPALLLMYGRTWMGSTLPTRYSRGRMKQCFQNAWLKATRSPHLDYVEGIALDHRLGIPMSHAWNVDVRTGEVVEPTWDAGPDITYLGLVIPLPVVRQARALSRRRGVVSVIDGDWARGSWFLTHGWRDAIDG